MGRAPCCTKVGLHRGPWTAREDALLIKYIQDHGEGQWRSLPKKAGLLRCGKSCRLRWMNYLRPDIKRGNITPEEDDLIIRLHALLGNRWSLIAGRLPGRTDNEIKNYWNTHLSKRLQATQETNPNIQKKVSEPGIRKRAGNASSNNRRRHKSIMNNNNRTGQKINQHKIILVEDETAEKSKVHLPKPAKVTSMVSMTSNGSNQSFESNVSNNTTTSASSSQSQSQVESLLNHGGIFDPDSIMIDIPWLSSNVINMGEENGLDTMMKMGLLCGEYVHHNIIEPNNDYHRAADLGAQDNKQFEKLYEEYLELIKADHPHIDIGGFAEEVEDQVQLDSFTESLLV